MYRQHFIPKFLQFYLFYINAIPQYFMDFFCFKTFNIIIWSIDFIWNFKRKATHLSQHIKVVSFVAFFELAIFVKKQSF